MTPHISDLHNSPCGPSFPQTTLSGFFFDVSQPHSTRHTNKSQQIPNASFQAWQQELVKLKLWTLAKLQLFERNATSQLTVELLVLRGTTTEHVITDHQHMKQATEEENIERNSIPEHGLRENSKWTKMAWKIPLSRSKISARHYHKCGTTPKSPATAEKQATSKPAQAQAAATSDQAGACFFSRERETGHSVLFIL